MRKQLLIDLGRPVQAILGLFLRVVVSFGYYVSSSAICGHPIKCVRWELYPNNSRP